MRMARTGQEDQERRWVEGVRAGDARAFEDLFYAYAPPLYAFAADLLGARDAAEEVVNDVFVAVWKRQGRWQPRGPLRPYLYQAVRNRAATYARRRKARQTMEEPLEGPARAHGATPAEAMELADLAEAVWASAAEMPERRRTVYLLHRQHGLTYAEIAQVMGLAPKTVENHMGLALRFLRDKLAPDQRRR